MSTTPSKMIIRPVDLSDSNAIAEIYNHYILNSVASFETEALSYEAMEKRIIEVSSNFPYYVCEIDGNIAGYCYAHPWKERAAYKYTLETTVYINPLHLHKGIGYNLMTTLIESCTKNGFHALIACITGNNKASIALHKKLGFKKVSHFEQVGYKHNQILDVVDYQLLLNAF